MSHNLSALGSVGGGTSGGHDDTLAAMRSATQDVVDFQSMLLDIQRSQTTFNMIVNAKQEGMKSMSDIAREGIRKSAAA